MEIIRLRTHPNMILADDKLSWGAKGVMLYLLMMNFEEKNDGYFKEYLNELVAFGYIELIINKDTTIVKIAEEYNHERK